MAANETKPLITTTEVTTRADGSPSIVESSSDQGRERHDGSMVGERSDVEAHGVGAEGEQAVWEGRYSLKNFVGRSIVRGILTLGWVAFAIYAWGYHPEDDLGTLVLIAGGLVGLLWLFLFYRMAQAFYSHHYRLTTRRLFIATGLWQRREDMMELIRVKDVFMKQSLHERWLGLGTVVVVATATDIPTFYVIGVEGPQEVMDLIWHHARAERDNRSVKVDQV